MKKVASLVAVVAVIGLLTLRSDGQNEPGNGGDSASSPVVVLNVPPPPTKLEKVSLAKGTLLTKGYTDIGTLQGEDGSTLRVTAIEIADANRRTRETGLAMQVASRSGRSAISFIDSDDIKPLLDAIDAIAKVDHSVTRMGDFEASYRTRGDFEIANIRTNSGRMVTITSTQILTPTGEVLHGAASFRASRLADLHQAIVTAQEALDQSRSEDK